MISSKPSPTLPVRPGAGVFDRRFKAALAELVQAGDVVPSKHSPIRPGE